MFLRQLMSSNDKLIQYAKVLHEQGLIHPDTYVLDVDTILENANMMLKRANELQIELLFMLKQLGRNPYLAKKLIELGYTGAVVVDYKEAELMIDNQIPLGNVGHLVQVPKHMLKKIIQARPKEITVYTMEKISQIQDVAKALNIHVSITLKVYKEGDHIYKSQEGGFALSQLSKVYLETKSFSHVHIEGVTAFPCFLYNEEDKQIHATPNASTVRMAKDMLEALGCTIKHINLPSATCTHNLAMIHEMGGNQGEPGHAFSGTTPYHAEHQVGCERPAYVYVSEISHQVKDKSYAFGGGYYRRGHIKEALINDHLVKVNPMDDSAIDYHIELASNNTNVGDCVIFCFRTQIFVTRSDVVLVEGLSKDEPHIVGRYDSLGRPL